MAARTTVVLLGGLLDAGGVLHRDAVLRPLCGRDEDWVRQLPFATTEVHAATEILARTVRSVGEYRVTRELVRALPVADRDYLIMKLRQITFGSRVELVLDCPACGAPMDIDFDLDSVPVEARPQQPEYRLRTEEGPELRFRLPRVGDVEEAGDGNALLARCTDGAAAAPAIWSALDEEIERVSPKVNPDFEAACPGCGHAFTAPFDPVAVLLRDLHRREPQFDRGVHLLSFYYHWPLSEILALTPARREHYVDLLSSQMSGVS
jgi:hypothetical protein